MLWDYHMQLGNIEDAIYNLSHLIGQMAYSNADFVMTNKWDVLKRLKVDEETTDKAIENRFWGTAIA